MVFYFSKADATRLKTGGRQFLKSRHFTLQNRQFKFFKSRRFTPPYRLRRSQLVQKPALRASKPPTVALIFSKPALRASNSPTTFSIFQSRRFTPQNRIRAQFFKSRRFASQYRIRRSQFFSKSRRFAPQYRLRWFQFFQKPALHSSKPPMALSILSFFFSKAGVSRLKNAYSDFNFFKAGVLRLKTAYSPSNFSVFFKSRRLAPQYRLRQFPFFQKPALRAPKVQIATGGFFFFSKAGASRRKSS